MADPRVHPSAPAADSIPPPTSPGERPLLPQSNPAQTPSDSYVIRFPREQVLSHPPPENAAKFEALSRSGKRRGCFGRCCCFTLCLLLFLIIAAGVSAGVLYLVFRFKAPNYSVTDLAISGVSLTSSGSISPGFDVTIRADNPNRKVGIYYLEDSSVNVFYDGVKLSSGVFPAFYQPRKNVTIIQTVLTGSDVVLGDAVRTALVNAANRRMIPFVVRTKVPVKIRVGSVNTWKITVRVKCDVVVDSLSDSAGIVSNDCDYGVKLW